MRRQPCFSRRLSATTVFSRLPFDVGACIQNVRDVLGILAILQLTRVPRTGAGIDSDKLNTASHAAIRGGRLELVQNIWNAGGDSMHPALTYVDAHCHPTLATLL